MSAGSAHRTPPSLLSQLEYKLTSYCRINNLLAYFDRVLDVAVIVN